MSPRKQSSVFVFAVCLFCGIKGSSAAQQQYFRVRPEDTEVGQGGSVVIPCEVGNRGGRVQWTKDGLTLGYDRSLPGFPRYSLVGDDASGVFNLKIANASLNDDAVFECQVGPSPDNRPIRASARLHVMLPPTLIEIVGFGSGSRLEVNENEEVELRCVVHDAKPKATVIWYRQNQEFLTETREDSDQTGSSPDRISSTSIIRFRPSENDNQVTWACEAQHPALLNPPMRASVLLSVLYPPGQPEITGYIAGETIRKDQSVTLICISRGGNPLAELKWFRNDIIVDSSYTNSGRESRNTYTFMASTDDNNAKYRCEATNTLSTQPKTAEIILSVQFAPDALDLRGPSSARVGESRTFECVTTNSNPPATVQWIVNNRTEDALSSHSVLSPRGGFVTHSNFSVQVTEHDKNKMITCQVVNPDLGVTIHKSTILTVIYPPGTPQIQGLDDDDVLTAGRMKRVTCVSLGGNPLATLKWFRGDEELEARYITQDNYASAEVAFIPFSSDNNGDLRCEATNPASPDPVVASVTLTVQFPPEAVKLSVRPDRPRAGRNATLSCESDSSFPAAHISWWHNGEKLQGSTEMIMSGQYGGAITVSHLHLALTAQHHGAVVTCEATNEVVGRSAHDAVTLGVDHKPVFGDSPSAPLEFIEGRSALINMTAVANPPTVSYQWSRDDRVPSAAIRRTRIDHNDGRFHVLGGLVNISRVERQDAGYFTVTASNEEGSTTTRFKIDVLYEPRIVYITEYVLVSPGEPAHFECAADAKPLTPKTIQWTRDDYPMQTRTKTTEGSSKKKLDDEGNDMNMGVLLLTVLNATAEDSGMFWCVANNGIGDKIVKKSTFLLVRHKPQIRQTPLLSKSAAEERHTARLLCEATGVPNVTFSWSRVGDEHDFAAEDSKKYQILNSGVDPMTWRSEFLIRDVEKSDYGQYECIARNNEGTSRQRVSLGPRSRPDVPTHLQVVNVTHRSVFLTWQPGFHGGMDQYFRIRFSSDAKSGYEYRDVYPSNTDEFLVAGLDIGVQYSFAVMAFNNLGESNYSKEPIIARTSSQPPLDSREQMIREALEGKAEIPLIVIISVSVCGTLLLCLNVVLISCFVYKKRQKENDQKRAPSSEGSSSTGSTKSGTMELYTTSSYNETMSGETLSSISEKSCISGNNHEYHHHHHQAQPVFLEDGLRPNSLSTYLVDPPVVSRPTSLDPQPLYGEIHPAMGSVTPAEYDDRHALYSTVNKAPRRLQESPNNYEETESEYAVELRRQAYIQTIGDAYSRSQAPYSTLPPPPPPIPSTPTYAHSPPTVSFAPSVHNNGLHVHPDQENGYSGGESESPAPLCASSPKRAMSAFTTFGPQRATPISTPLTPPKLHPAPTTGHLV